MPSRDLRRLEPLLRSQRGLLTLSQAAQAGLTTSAVRHQLAAGRWSQPLPRVYAVTTGPLPPVARLQAALLYAGSGARLSHRTAAAYWRFPVDAPADVDVQVHHNRRVTSQPGLRIRRCRHLTGQRPVRLGGLAVVRRPLCVVQTAGEMLRLNDVRALVAFSVQRRLVALEDLALAFPEARGPGRSLLRRALLEVDLGAESAPEAQFAALVRDGGVSAPDRQVILGDPQGRPARVDFAWLRSRLVVEIDGMAWHLSPGSWRRDLERQNALVDSGYVVLRFTTVDLRDRPEWVVDLVRRALARAA